MHVATATSTRYTMYEYCSLSTINVKVELEVVACRWATYANAVWRGATQRQDKVDRLANDEYPRRGKSTDISYTNHHHV